MSMKTKITNRQNAWLAGTSILALALSAMPAIAQDAETDTDDNSRRLSTVTVTATQRAESIQDVPIAITALDPETLDRAGVSDVTSLDTVAPSFNMNSSDTTTGGTTLRIRGVGTTGNNVGLESSVGVFLDGVYLSRPGIALGDLVDLEQVEVLRGPQGTLFGRNTSAGALNIKTKAPDLNEYEGFANITFGNYSLFNLQGGFNIPVVEDKFAIRVTGALRDRDGYVEGLNGNDSYDRDRSIIRAQALLDLDNFGTLRGILDFSETDEACCHAILAGDDPTTGPLLSSLFPDTDGGLPNRGGLDALRSNDSAFSEKVESTGFSLEYNVDTPIGALTYIGSHREWESNTFRSTDFVATDIFTVNQSPEALALGNFAADPGTNIDTTTHELRLQDTAFDGRLDWLIGGYYSEESIVADGSLTIGSDYQTAVGAAIFGSPTALLGLSGGVDATGDFANNRFFQDGESLSVFTHNIFSVTDKLDLTLGLRYVEETKDARFEQLAGEHDACYSTFTALPTVFNATINDTFGALVGAGADPTDPAVLEQAVAAAQATAGGAVALNCFIFAAPVVDFSDPGFAPFLAQTEPFLADGVTPNPNAALRAFFGFLGQEFDETFEDEELVYTLKASYDLTDDISVYGGYTHGFKSGGFNLDSSAGAGGASPSFDSEKVDAWELGMKGDFFDGRARANIAVFHQDLEDFQVLEFTGIRFQTFNVDKAQSTGFEIETEAQLNNYFYGGLAYSYTDANYPDDCSPQDPTDPNFLAQAASLCGADFTNAPNHVVTGNLGYQNQWLGNDFFANLNFRSEGERRTSTQPGLPFDIQDSRTKINARIGLAAADEKWAVELWGNNITDEVTTAVTFSVPLRGAARGQYPQEPATYGVTLRTKF